jgi:Protein of unknown function (DUF4235)
VVKLLYAPMRVLAGVFGGILATCMFNAAWKALDHHDKAPASTDADRSWSGVITAAVLRGALFGLVTAVLERGGAVGFERATGAWPGVK